MTIGSSALTRAAGVAAAVAGLACIVIQVIHPADGIASITTQSWAGLHLLSLAEAVLALVGITGVYLRHARRFGLLGLIGYLMFGVYFLLQSAFNFAEALIAPLIAKQAPGLTVGFVNLLGPTPAVTNLGPLAALPVIGGARGISGRWPRSSPGRDDADASRLARLTP